MEEALRMIASFLGGALITAIGFMFAFVSRLTKVETNIDNLCKNMDAHIKAPSIPCSLHTDMMQKLAILETQLEERKEN